MNVRVTTVSRGESTVGQSPAAVFVITQEMIHRSGATNIPDLLRMVPGMDVARTDANKWNVSARGLNERFSRFMLVQMDGRTVYYPVFSGTYWDTVDYVLDDIERIEVIRGPGASVWGANAVNGIINIITKSTKDTHGGLISGGGGTEERAFGSFRFGGQIGDNLHYRVYGKAAERAGQFVARGNPFDQWRSDRFGMRLDWTPTSQDTATLQGERYHSNAGRNDVRPMPVSPFTFQNLEDEDSVGGNVLARWSHQIDKDSNWTLQLYWDRAQRDSTNDVSHFRIDTLDLDFQHNFPLGSRQKLTYGAAYRFTNLFFQSTHFDGNFLLNFKPEKRTTHLFSAFVQDEISVVPDRLSLILGSKIEHNDFTGWEYQPTGRLLWTPDKRQSAWLAASRAVRTPNFIDDDVIVTTSAPFRAPNGALGFPRILGNTGIQSERGAAYELGYRIQATDKLSLDLAAFYNVYDDLRVRVTQSPIAGPAPGTFILPLKVQNGMDADVEGIEMAATWKPVDWWRLYGAYTYLTMHLHRAGNLGLSPRDEIDEKLSPQNQVYLQSSWDLPRNVQFDLIGRYVDRVPGFAGAIPPVDNYLSLDARLAWKPSKNLEFAITGQNLLDNHHAESDTNLVLQTPLVEIRRGIYGTVTFTW